MSDVDGKKIVMVIPHSLSKIDKICEKFLDATMRSGKTVEIFVQPSKRDMKNAQEAEGSYSKNLRFIADGNKKLVYVWNAALMLHADMLRWLQDEGHISRSVRLYNDPDVVSGEWNDRDQIELYYNVNWGPEEMGNQILDGDWSWVGKTGMKDFERKLMKTVYDSMKSSRKEIDPRIAKAAGF